MTTADWLREHKWDYWATTTFNAAVSHERAAAQVQEWLRELQSIRNMVNGPGAKVYAVSAVEDGDRFGRTHVHLLLGGLGAAAGIKKLVPRSWPHGQIHFERYNPAEDPPGDPRSGACAYIVKHPDAYVIHGRLKRFRPRR